METRAVLFRQSVHNCQQPVPALRVSILNLGIRRRIGKGEPALARIGAATLAPSEPEIVGHAEYPTSQVVPRLSRTQVLKQRQENLLHDLLGIFHGQTHPEQVA